MHEEFEEWCKAVDLTDDKELRARYWKIVDDSAKSLTLEELSKLVGFLLLEQSLDRPLEERLVGETRPKQDGLLRLLTSSILATVIESSEDPNRSAGAALLISIAANFRGDIGDPAQVSQRAKRKITTAGFKARDRTFRIPKPSAPKFELDLSAPLEAVTSPGDTGQFTKCITDAATIIQEQMRNALSALARSHRDTTNELAQQFSLQDEELNLLWWALNQRSMITGESLESLPIGMRGIIAGLELARMHKVLPYAPSIGRIATRAGISSDSVKLTDAINSCSVAWIKEHVAPLQPLLLCPVLFGCMRRLETQDSEKWIPAWAEIVKISPDHQSTEDELAVAVVAEVLALRALQRSEG